MTWIAAPSTFVRDEEALGYVFVRTSSAEQSMPFEGIALIGKWN